MSTYVMSDIHGCYDLFLKMLDEISFSDEDSLILAGDYVDRGRQTGDMLRWLRERPDNVMALVGNHDLEFVEYINLMRRVDEQKQLSTDQNSNEDVWNLFSSTKYFLNQRKAPNRHIFDYYGTVDILVNDGVTTYGELCAWCEMIKKMPYTYRTVVGDRQCVIVHAGYIDDLKLVDGRYNSIEDFYVYAREDGIKYGGLKGGVVISGHTPTIADAYAYNDGEVFKYYDENKDCVFYDIDCGCAYREVEPSAALACMCLETMEVWYV